jgi:hypothetical protein
MRLEIRNLKLEIGIMLFALLFFVPVIVCAEALDTDGDGLSDEDEQMYYTDINNPDTDGDGYPDGLEVKNGYSPHKGPGVQMHQNDYDGDGLGDWLEIWFKSDIGKIDTDGDGHNDFDEVMRGFSPSEKDGEKKFRRWIEVDRSRQRLYYFVNKIKLLNLAVSTGNPWTETPKGDFEITKMIPEKSYVGADYNLKGVKWNMLFNTGGYYIHGTYWHNDFGIRTHSHGCVNLSTQDAGLLYKYMDIGVPIRIYGDTPKNRAVES